MASQIEIIFVGLCMFVGESGFMGKHVVMPDIPASITVSTPRGTTCVEPHVAYISASEEDVVRPCESCEPAGNGRLILRVPGHHVTVEGLVDEPFSDSDGTFAKCVPKLRESCPAFKPSPGIAAATLDITVGDLTGRQTAKGERGAIWQAATTGGNVVFRATRGGVTRTMTVRPETKSVEIGNRFANAFGSDRRPLADNHWLAFYAFSQSSVVCDLPGPAADCPVAPASHDHDPEYDTTVACSNSQYP
ncbi:MAG TPA: hypothetical protein VFP80_17350 [Thermoanaerobaculia bacterium]|nr:hypothetical protein [Thermoanaerobaculia bacterium]